MKDYKLESNNIQKVFDKYDLGQVDTFEEMKAGMINPVYLINNKYILRIEQHTFEQNPNKLKRESILFQLLPKYNIPTPGLIGFDDSKEIIDAPYIVLDYIVGKNLEQVFSNLSAEQQKTISYQLGDLAKKIHSVTFKDINNSLFGSVGEWVDKSMRDFGMYWEVVKDKDYVTPDLKEEIITTFEQFKKIKWNDKGRLTHGDFTSGNVQLNDDRIVGIFDFEFSFIADPLWDLQKLSSSFQLGSHFDRDEFLRGYGRTEFNQEEKIRIKMHSFHQGIWEIWATLTQFMPSGEDDIREGIEIITSTAEYKVLN